MRDHVEHIKDHCLKTDLTIEQYRASVNDPVNHPNHYTEGSIECIDAIRSALGDDGYRTFLRGQVLKYIWRGPLKGAEAQDYAKAKWYLERLIEVTG